MADPVLVLHFTQGTTTAGAIAAMRKARSECHEVVDPAMVGSQGMALTQQLLPWTTPARSLKHPAGRPETNNRGFGSNPLGRCYQVEIVGMSEKAATYGDVWYQRLGAYLDARCTALRIPPTFPLPFVGSQGYGSSAPTRLTWEAWGRVSGIVGHQHVPGNEHWDPGALDVARLTRYMETTTVPTPTTENPYPAETAEALELLAQHAGYAGDRLWFGPLALEALHRLKNDKLALAAANKTSADTMVRIVAQRDTALANREAAEAEAAKLRLELQTGGRMPQLLADLDAAVAKARA